MLSKTHAMAEAITTALGPIFRANPDYKTICQAMALTLARVAQATPKPGNEYHELDAIMCLASEAVTQFLDAEQAIQEQDDKLMDQGIEAFAEMARGVVAVEPGSAADHPDNCDQPVAKTAKPFNPHHTLEAFNGGMGRDAQAEAERFAGQDHGEEEVSAEEFYKNSGWSPRITPKADLEEINQVIRAAGGTPEAYDQAKADNT